MASGALVEPRSVHLILGLVLLLIGQSISPMLFEENSASSETSSRDGEIWDGGAVTWAQFGKNPSRNATTPAHAPPDQISNGELVSITDPVLNWNHFDDDDYGADTLGVSVGNFSANIDTSGLVLDSCARDSLSPVFIYNGDSSGDKHGYIRIVDGDSSENMWQVDIGVIDEDIKATPVIIDVNDDGKLEIIVVYETNGLATVEMWSPDIECDVTSWKPHGSHETERVWRWTHDTFQLSADRVNGCWSCPKPVSQPLLADLHLDGSPELVITLYDDINDEPNLVALPLPDSGEPVPLWEVTLDKGTHASDPAWTQIDAVSAAILLTTINELDGSMWIWRLDAATGQVQYDDSLQNTDGDTDAPHVRLPGPIITQLDSDPAPEMVITIPTDIDQSGTSDGAEFIGLNVIDASEIFSFSATNGYADAPPVLIDSDENGITDRICWNTWYRDGTSWHGVVGCHDYLESTQNIQHDWTQYIEGAATLNDEIAVSAPTAMDIDGAGMPEVIVTYGRNLFAHDGDTGSRASINSEWVSGLELPHRTWASHTLADFEGDGTLDLLVGDMLISTSGADVRPFEDGLAITFLPSTPNPGQNVQVTGWFENAGTASTDLDTFARMYVDGELVFTHREGALDPVEPTGDGNDGTFTFDWSGGLGNHTFTLKIDEHGNLSQTRTDNDNATTVLTILAPYNISIGVPNDPVRVLPGGQQDVLPLITSTGRLSGTWSMSIDDSGLPDNWTITDLNPSGSSNVEIDVGGTWSPTLRISAPSEALGTDAGFVVLTMTLDSDENVTQTAILPIEAERTRGLSVRGPAGTNVSTGFGIPGEDAAAWILIENLGNAPEDVELSWDSTAWSSDLKLYDNTNTQVIPLTLQPSQSRELTARLPVPPATALGNSVSTPLTLCIGIAEVDQECSTIELTFVANNVQILPPHIRSVPADNLIWNIEIQLPASVDELEWDMASAGMIMAGWSWSSSGAFTVDGTTLRAHGNVGGRITGTLELDMPYAPPPMLHQWSSQEANQTGHTLTLSLQVLQKYRAVADITFPTEEPHRMDVNVQETMMLRLENTGNGPDVYDISWHVVENLNFSGDPGLTVSIPSSQYAIGAGELRSIPIGVTLPEDMVAAQGLILAFEMRSQGDIDVFSTTSILVEARQDHQWQMVLEYQGVNLTSGATINADPGDVLDLILYANNSGNLVDDIVLTPSISVHTEGLDDGLGWSASGGAASNVEVNSTSSIPLLVNVSTTAWMDTTATISFDGMSDDTSIPPFVIQVDVNHVPGWWILAGGADLDIDRNGENITLIVEQRGNSPAIPYLNGWVNVNGWDINLSEDLPMLNPGEQANFTCEIIPPSGAISGHTVELTLRAKNDDGSGEGQTTLPLRVASWHDYRLTHETNWTISQYGGMPLAMLTNLGNAPTSIDVEILGMPVGWTLQGPSVVSLGVGESVGIPISAIPDSGGGGFNTSVTLRTTDEDGTEREVLLKLTESERAWASSPVLFGTSGDTLELEFHPLFENNNAQHNGMALTQNGDGDSLWDVPSSDEDGLVTVDGTALEYWARVRNPPNRMGSCTVYTSESEPLAVCSLFDGIDSMQWTAILRDETGFIIDHSSGFLASNTSLDTINLSGVNWSPAPGTHILRATLFDGHGGQIAQSEREVIIQDTDWNLAITATELRKDSGMQNIVVSISRENYSKLSDAICELHLSDDTWGAVHRVNVAGDIAPQIVIKRPPLDDGVTVQIELVCASPWNEDNNPSDNLGFIILADGISTPEEGLDFALLIGGIVVVFGAMGLLGMIRPESRKRKVRTKKSTTSSKSTQRKSGQRNSGQIDDIDDIFLEDEEVEVTAIDSEPETTSEVSEDESVSVVEEEPLPLDEFEARLERLRRRL